MTGAAFFDLDRTMVARPSGFAFGGDFYRAGLISRTNLMRGYAAQTIYLLRGADEARMERWRLRGLDLSRGRERAGFGRVIERSMDAVIRPIIYREALELMEWHQAMRRPVFLVSSSPEEVVDPIGRLLGVDGVIATKSKVDAEGRYVGELEFYCFGPYKAAAMAELAATRGIRLGESWAYSDSITDLPMLEAVGHPVATNPDRDLRRVAKQRGWPVAKFKSPTAVRPLRMATATPVRKAALASAVGLVALAAMRKVRRG